jgi:uncharacterized membrane protein YfcA
MELAAGALPDGVGVLVALLLIAASFFTSALTATFGIGGGVAMLALLGLVLPVAALIPVHGAIQLGSNTGRAWHQRRHIRFALALPFVAGSLIGIAAGAALVVQLPDAVLKLLLGTFIVVIVWAKVPGFDRLSSAGVALGGAVTGFIGMFVGATGPLLSSFFAQMIPDNRRTLVATQAAGMTLHHGFKVIAFALAGFAFADWLPLVAAMIVTGYLGTVFGSRLLDRLDEGAFRKWFRIGLTVLALDLVRRGLTGLI